MRLPWLPLALFPAAFARAMPAGVSPFSPALLCQAAIASAEQSFRIPDAFLSAIGRVESGRGDNGRVAPWPWTINAEGQGHFFDSKAEAIDAVRALEARGVHSIDVGCLQVNLANHPDAFASLEQAFDPPSNAAYAARFLLTLFHQTGSWPRAAAAYHSQTPAIGAEYQQRVLAAWAEPEGEAAPAQPARNRDEAPDVAVAAPAAAPPAVTGLAITRRLSVAAPAVSGRTLAAYRAFPVRMMTALSHFR